MRSACDSTSTLHELKSADGSFDIQFGGCDDKIANCLPIAAGWNSMVRLYRPHAEILNGTWTFLVAAARQRPHRRSSSWSPATARPWPRFV